MNINHDFGFGVSTCTRCGSELHEFETLSRCLKCLKSTPWEVSGKEYYKNKNNNGDDNIED
jgi:hypothetical protein